MPAGYGCTASVSGKTSPWLSDSSASSSRGSGLPCDPSFWWIQKRELIFCSGNFFFAVGTGGATSKLFTCWDNGNDWIFINVFYNSWTYKEGIVLKSFICVCCFIHLDNFPIKISYKHLKPGSLFRLFWILPFLYYYFFSFCKKWINVIFLQNTSQWNWTSEVAQSCPTLCYPMDCSLPGFSMHGIFQARMLEWVAFSFSRGSSRPRGWTQVSHIAGRRFTVWAQFWKYHLRM